MDEEQAMAMMMAQGGGAPGPGAPAAPMAAPAPGMDPAMMGAAPGGEPESDMLLQMLMQALIEGFQTQEAEVDQGRESVAQMLMAMLQQQQGPPVDPMMGYAEGAQSPVAGPPLG